MADRAVEDWRTDGCQCSACRPVVDDAGPPITAAQRAYCDEFVAWFRAGHDDRQLPELRLVALKTLAGL